MHFIISSRNLSNVILFSPQNHHSLSLPIISHGVTVRMPAPTHIQLTFTSVNSLIRKQASSSIFPYCPSHQKEGRCKYLLSVFLQILALLTVNCHTHNTQQWSNAVVQKPPPFMPPLLSHFLLKQDYKQSSSHSTSHFSSQSTHPIF